MKTQAPAATAVTVAATLSAYTGLLGRFLQKQAEAKAAAQQHAATLHALRTTIMDLMVAPLFDAAEQLRCNDSVYQCDCVAQLQTWLRNVQRVYTERETALHLAFADGTYLHLSVAA